MHNTEHEILVFPIRILLLYCLCMEEGTNARVGYEGQPCGATYPVLSLLPGTSHRNEPQYEAIPCLVSFPDHVRGGKWPGYEATPCLVSFPDHVRGGKWPGYKAIPCLVSFPDHVRGGK